MTDAHAHVRFAHRLWDAVATGDAVNLRMLLADEVIWRSMGQNLLSGDYRGPQGVVDYLAKVGELTDDFQSTLTDVYHNESGAIVLSQAMASRGVKRLDMTYVMVLTIQNGRLVHALTVPVDQVANDRFWV